jgi:hypothetical protein
MDVNLYDRDLFVRPKKLPSILTRSSSIIQLHVMRGARVRLLVCEWGNNS